MLNQINTIQTDMLLEENLDNLRGRNIISRNEYISAARRLCFPIDESMMDEDTENRLNNGKQVT